MIIRRSWLKLILLLLLVAGLIKIGHYLWAITMTATADPSEAGGVVSDHPSRSGRTEEQHAFAGYGAIAEKNLFRPLGWEPTVPAPTRPTAPPSLPPRPSVQVREVIPYFTLTGIVQDGTDRLAVLEGSNTQDVYFVRPGEQLMGATLSMIRADHVVFKQDGREAEVALGQRISCDAGGTLLLSSVFAAGEASPEGRPESTAISATSTETDDVQTSLLERMRARRRREVEQP